MSNATSVERPCRFCGGEITSSKPEVDFCRNCFYTGRFYEDEFAPIIESLRALDNVRSVNVWHTGGGCFNLATTLVDDRVVTSSLAVRDGDTVFAEPMLPEKDGDAWAVVVAESEAAWSDYDESKLSTPNRDFDDDELVAFVRDLGTVEREHKTRECTCRFYDDGDPENGPHLAVDYDEACPQHGRDAMPDEWAEHDVPDPPATQQIADAEAHIERETPDPSGPSPYVDDEPQSERTFLVHINLTLPADAPEDHVILQPVLLDEIKGALEVGTDEANTPLLAECVVNVVDGEEI